ncbi:restriction endonuclease subunit S [Corynebacterium doosanense]|uniref:restriction endonuclease subunit S n=1 Tax=Corynebacterium doosanense TaxID=1121358 RepID=UPI0012DE1D9D|nr:restriction endonuclease subunit S [Corynebacterium doosanense]
MSNYRVVRPGQLAANMMWLNFGGLGVSQHLGYISPAYMAFDLDEVIWPAFAHYLLRSRPYISAFAALGTGVRPNSQMVNFTLLSALPVPLPPLATQRAIADYLDRETGEIDAMLAKLEGLVGLLKERRKTQIINLLSHSSYSTKTARVGVVCDIIRRGMSPTYADDGVAVINQKCIRPGGWIDLQYIKYHSDRDKTPAPELFVQTGDILVCSTGDGTLGRSAIWRDAPAQVIFDSHVTIVRPFSSRVVPTYLAAVIAANESEFIRLSHGSTKQTELARDTVSETTLPLPPLDEQERIVAHLDESTARIDRMIAKAHQLRDLLTERRSALITAAVTGQIEIG